MRPVLYLDIDDTLLSWTTGSPAAVPGTERFLRWALDRFEVRWLSRWCPGGSMSEELLRDLSKMVGIDAERLALVPACMWNEEGIKADGIAWLEHVAGGREFAWVENRDGLADRDFEVLRVAGYDDCYYSCDVTHDPGALDRTRIALERRFGGAAEVAA